VKVDLSKSALENTLLSSHGRAIMVVLLISGAQTTHFLGFTTSLEGVHEFSTFYPLLCLYVIYRYKERKHKRKKEKNEGRGNVGVAAASLNLKKLLIKRSTCVVIRVIDSINILQLVDFFLNKKLILTEWI